MIITTTNEEHRFKSPEEGARYIELKFQQQCGIIKNLSLRPSFLLQEGFLYRGEKIEPVTYIATFRYQKDEETVIEDVKGKLTPLYKLKRKMFLKLNPRLRHVETMKQ